MSGESPTRPTRLLVMPPVEVAAARWPCMSSATAPTVPNFLSSSNGGLVMAGPSWLGVTRPTSWPPGTDLVGDHAAHVAHAVQLLAACVGREEEGLDHLQAAVAREGLGARAGQQH